MWSSGRLGRRTEQVSIVEEGCGGEPYDRQRCKEGLAISGRAKNAGSSGVVWPLIGEAERWKDWSFMTRTYLLREGSPDRNGVGALRRFAVGPFGSCEEVVEFEPPSHLGYVARKGIPVKSYRGDIRLAPDGDGTVV